MFSKTIIFNETNSEVIDINSIPKDVDKEFLEYLMPLKDYIKNITERLVAACETAVKEDDKNTFAVCREALDSLKFLLRNEYLSESIQQLLIRTITDVNHQIASGENVLICADVFTTIAMTLKIEIKCESNYLNSKADR